MKAESYQAVRPLRRDQGALSATFPLISVPLRYRFLENYAAESRSAVSNHSGMFLSNFQRALAAVVVGNLIYFSLSLVLPPALRHGITRVGIGDLTVAVGRFDLGMLIDFLICAALFILFGALWSKKNQESQKTHS
jgi:hypothetical protein